MIGGSSIAAVVDDDDVDILWRLLVAIDR